MEGDISGAERFARFLIAWHLFCGTDPSVTETWKEISSGYTDFVKESDSRTLISAMQCTGVFRSSLVCFM